MTDDIKKDNKLQNDTPMDTGEVKEVKEEVVKVEEAEVKVEVKAEVKSEISEEKEVKKTETETKVKAEVETEKKPFIKKPFKRTFKKRKPFKREKPEFDQKILSLRRVTRVMAGGRRFSFAVAMVVGDKKGRVGFGTGKSEDTVAAIQKAVRNAKKSMIKVNLTKDGSIPYNVSAKYKSSEIQIRPIKGKGLAAGGAVRTILEYAGIKEGGAKILSRSKNHINNAKAALKALEPFSKKVEVQLLNKKKSNHTRKKFIKKPFIKKVIPATKD